MSNVLLLFVTVLRLFDWLVIAFGAYGKNANSIIFERSTVNIDRIYYRAWHLKKEWTALSLTYISLTISSLPSCKPTPKVYVQWRPLPQGYCKLNFDGSVVESSASAGVVIRNSAGHVLAAQAYHFGHTSTLVVEAWGLCNGLISTQNLNMQKTIR